MNIPFICYTYQHETYKKDDTFPDGTDVHPIVKILEKLSSDESFTFSELSREVHKTTAALIVTDGCLNYVSNEVCRVFSERNASIPIVCFDNSGLIPFWTIIEMNYNTGSELSTFHDIVESSLEQAVFELLNGKENGKRCQVFRNSYITIIAFQNYLLCFVRRSLWTGNFRLISSIQLLQANGFLFLVYSYGITNTTKAYWTLITQQMHQISFVV